MEPNSPTAAAVHASGKIDGPVFHLALKIGWTAWMLLWIPFYWDHYGPQNFLWFCDLANMLIGVGLWLESPLVFSWQAVSVLLVQILYTIDITVRLFFGFHPIGGSEYMFDPVNYPLHIRLLSLFHVVTPPLLIWAIWKLGYDRRAFVVQTMTAWIVLPICFFLFGPEKDINWVWGPLDAKQDMVSPWLYFAFCLVSYPLLLYYPAHRVLSRLAPKPKECTFRPILPLIMRW